MEELFGTNQEHCEKITSLKQRVKELDKSQTQFDQIEEILRISNEVIANMSEGVVLIQASNRTILYANPTFENIFGYEKKELEGKRISVINAPTDRTPEEVEAEISIVLRDKGLWQGEVLNRKKDGTTFWCFANVSTLQHSIHGEVWVSVHADITDRKRAERELWKQYELQRVLLSAIPAYVYLKDRNSVYILGNKQFSELSGMPESDIPGKTDYDFFSKTDADRFRQDDAEIMASGNEKLHYEVKGEDAKGNTIWYSTSKSPFYDPSGNMAGLVGICINITDRKRSEEELARYRDRLEELVKERTEELEDKTQSLQEFNAALKVLLQQRDDDRKELESRYASNIRNLLYPYVEKLKKSHLDERQKSYVEIVETHLTEIVSPLLKNLQRFNFTPAEAQVASLIRNGKSTKEIAEVLMVATGTVDNHRKNIRKKLGLKRMKANLQMKLRLIEE